jgi:hypothetical protein
VRVCVWVVYVCVCVSGVWRVCVCVWWPTEVGRLRGLTIVTAWSSHHFSWNYNICMLIRQVAWSKWRVKVPAPYPFFSRTFSKQANYFQYSRKLCSIGNESRAPHALQGSQRCKVSAFSRVSCMMRIYSTPHKTGVEIFPMKRWELSGFSNVWHQCSGNSQRKLIPKHFWNVSKREKRGNGNAP